MGAEEVEVVLGGTLHAGGLLGGVAARRTEGVAGRSAGSVGGELAGGGVGAEGRQFILEELASHY